MECPRCGALLGQVGGRAVRCACGWNPSGDALRASLKLLIPGLLLDLSGTLLIVYSVVSARTYVALGVILMVAGSVLLVAGARRISAAAKIRKEPEI
jgi:hypothetical protein